MNIHIKNKKKKFSLNSFIFIINFPIILIQLEMISNQNINKHKQQKREINQSYLMTKSLETV